MITEFLKELGGWILVVLAFSFILGICLTGGGILSPDFWQIVLSR